MAQFAASSSWPALLDSPQQDLMVQLAAWQHEMAKLKADNSMLREVLVAPKDDDDDDEAENDRETMDKAKNDRRP